MRQAGRLRRRSMIALSVDLAVVRALREGSRAQTASTPARPVLLIGFWSIFRSIQRRGLISGRVEVG